MHHLYTGFITTVSYGKLQAANTDQAEYIVQTSNTILSNTKLLRVMKSAVIESKAVFKYSHPISEKDLIKCNQNESYNFIDHNSSH